MREDASDGFVWKVLHDPPNPPTPNTHKHNELYRWLQIKMAVLVRVPLPTLNWNNQLGRLVGERTLQKQSCH